MHVNTTQDDFWICVGKVENEGHGLEMGSQRRRLWLSGVVWKTKYVWFRRESKLILNRGWINIEFKLFKKENIGGK